MKKILLAFATVLGLAACSETADSLNGKTFTLLPDKNITLSFDTKEHRFFGQAVNNYFGNYKAQDGNIVMSLMGSTMMAAPEPEMKKEADYFAALSKVKKYTLKNKILKLTGEGVVLQYEQTATNQE